MGACIIEPPTRVRGHAWRVFLALTVMAWPGLATAEPYCVTGRTFSPQCIYVDPDSCRAAADKLHGYCTVNEALTLSQSGTSRYCTIRPDQSKLCVYADRATCNAAAAQLHTACVDAVPNALPNGAADPFRFVRP